MKHLIALCLLSLFAASCVPTPDSADEARTRAGAESFRCMWTGVCN